MRFIARVGLDPSSNNDYAEFTLTREMAATILTGRKKVKELKTGHFELKELAEISFQANDKVKYFSAGWLGEAFSDGSDPDMKKDLLTEKQRDDLENADIVQVEDGLKLYMLNGDEEPYDTTHADSIVVNEQGWWFRSYQDGMMLETIGLDFDLLQRVL